MIFLNFFTKTLACFGKSPYLCIAFDKKPRQNAFGEMSEWSNVPVLKTGVPQGTGGSNPSLSAL